VWVSADGEKPWQRDPEAMRILLALGGDTFLPPGEAATELNRRRNAKAAAKAIAKIAREHELIVTHEDGAAAHTLELALRNALPERDVVSVLTQVVVAMDDPAAPQAIAEVRSLRALLDAGALVICTAGTTVPVALDGLGTMYEVDAPIEQSLIVPLLARRVDADAVLNEADVDSLASKLAAAKPT
jgi:carbamate kinase